MSQRWKQLLIGTVFRKNKPKVDEVGTITEPIVKVKSRTIGIETTKQALTERGSDAWKSDIKHGVSLKSFFELYC